MDKVYVVQTNAKVIERCLLMATDPGDLVLDPASRQVHRAHHPVALSAREFDILALLLKRAGRAVSRYTILDEVWDGDTDLRSNTIDVHVASLRAKIDRPFGRNSIQAVRGVGYRFDPVPLAPTGRQS